jgi:hypothetical protein
MESNLDKIALDLYDKIQTKFPEVEMGDEHGDVLSKKEDIPKARFFEFEYKENDKVLGTIAITLDVDDGVVVQISREIVDSKHHGAYKFIRGFRRFAKDRLLNFDIKNIGKSNLDKRDYAFQSKAKEEPMNPIMENKMFGTSRMSYQDLGEARLVVKHSQAVNPDLPAGRTMHIEAIYIENANGERFRYPHKHLNGARALAEHIKAGGNPYDGIGKHITSLSEELAQLRKFKGYVGRNANLAEAMGGITDIVFERIETIKKQVGLLQRPAYYSQFAESFEAYEEEMIPEEIVSDLVDRLTIRTFNEDLKSAFPYIFRLVDESSIPVKELTPEDILGEADDEEDTPHSHQAKATLKHLKKAGYGDKADAANIKPGTKGFKDRYDMLSRAEKEGNLKDSYNPEDQFESFMNNIYNENMNADDHVGIFSSDSDIRDNAVNELNRLLSSDFKGGAAGDANVAMSLKDLVPNAIIGKLATLDPELDVHSALQMALQDEAEQNPDLQDTLDELDFTKSGDVGGEEVAAAGPATDANAPAAPPPAAPPVPAPTAEAPPVVDPNAPPVPAPIAEDSEDPPFDPDPPRKTPPALAGKHGQGHSTAKHLAKQGLIKAIHAAKKAGADLDTELDFGHSKKTLHDTIRECGMSPKDFGFEQKTGVQEILQSISGFWNRDAESQGLHEGNFTKGGTWTKSHVISNFKNGAYENATPDDVRRVCKMIDRMDPPSSVGHEQSHILKLAGVAHHAHPVDEEASDADYRNGMDMDSDNAGDDTAGMNDRNGMDVASDQFPTDNAELDNNEKSQVQQAIQQNAPMSQIGQMMKAFGIQMPKLPGIDGGEGEELRFDDMGPQIQKFIQNMTKNMPNATSTSTQSGTINGQPAQFNDVKSQFDKMMGAMGGQGAQGMDFKPADQANLLQVDNPEYVARRAAALQKPGAVVGHTTVSESSELTAMLKIAGLR